MQRTDRVHVIPLTGHDLFASDIETCEHVSASLGFSVIPDLLLRHPRAGGNLQTLASSSHNEKSNDNNEDGKGGPTGGQTNVTDSTTVVLQAIINDPYITRIKLSELMGIAPSAVQKHINKLKKQGIIKRNGGDFGGHWEILEKK